MDNATKKLILKTCMFTPGLDGGWGLPLTIWGEPGTAKSALMVQVAAENGLHPIVLAPNSRSPMDIMGLPHIDESKYGTPVTTYATPEWAIECADRGRALLFIDERNTADPALQAPMLRILRDKVVGEFQLPGSVRVMSACNPVDQAANGWEEAPALANRSGHLDWGKPSPKDWIAAVTSKMLAAPGTEEARAHGDADPSIAEAIEAEVLEKWETVVAKWWGFVGAYVNTRPELFHKMPETNDPQSSKAWASSRTWELATRVLAGGEIHGMSRGQQMTMVAAFIGEDAAFDFAHWLNNQDLPEPADVLDGRVKFEHDRSRLDRTFAVLDSCAVTCRTSTGDTQKSRVKAMWALVNEITTEAPDATIAVISKLVKMGDAGEVPKMHRDSNYKQVMEKFTTTLQRMR